MSRTLTAIRLLPLLTAALCWTAGVWAATPLSDDDMADVRIVSGDVLNVMGAPAAGSAEGAPATNGADTITSRPVETGSEQVGRLSAYEPEGPLRDQRIIRARQGDTVISMDGARQSTEVQRHNSVRGPGLVVNTGNQIDRVQVNTANRGDFMIQNINANNAVTINPR
ncbi:MAG: hypothetical protein LAT63_13195 [Marinobacter sp.]|nr:hypothetical protein [Marinobacter sp.]